MLTKQVFISYRSLDSQIARALTRCLETAGCAVYLDERDPELDAIQVGSTPERNSLMGAIFTGLRNADALVAVITRRTRGSWRVPAEISAALQQGKEVVLVCEPGVRPPDFAVSRVIDNLEDFVTWLKSIATQPINSAAGDSLEAAMFSNKSDDVRLASLNAIEKIEALWDPRTWPELRLEEPAYAHRRLWMGCRSTRLIATLYAVSAPIYMYKRAAPRLDRSELEREVAAVLYESWTDEESLAALHPAFTYEARKCTDWRSLRDRDPQRYWLQGMKPKDIDSLFDEMTVSGGRLIEEDAFSNLYLTRYSQHGGAQKPLGLAANPLQGFTVPKRPAFSRVLAVHARLHHALLRLDDAAGVSTTSLERLLELPATSRLTNWEGAGAGLDYLTRRLGPRLNALCRA